jgi:hypothetical protein
MLPAACLGTCFVPDADGNFRDARAAAVRVPEAAAARIADQRERPCGCALVFCPNESVCRRGGVPQWLLAVNDGVCCRCHGLFGAALRRLTVEHCPLCLLPGAPDDAVAVPDCGHALCADCFRWCFWCHVHRLPAPDFPFPDRWGAYTEKSGPRDGDGDGGDHWALFNDDERPAVRAYAAQVRRVEWMNSAFEAKCPSCGNRPTPVWKVFGRLDARRHNFRLACGRRRCRMPTPDVDAAIGVAPWVDGLLSLVRRPPGDGCVRFVSGVGGPADILAAAHALHTFAAGTLVVCGDTANLQRLLLRRSAKLRSVPPRAVVVVVPPGCAAKDLDWVGIARIADMHVAHRGRRLHGDPPHVLVIGDGEPPWPALSPQRWRWLEVSEGRKELVDRSPTPDDVRRMSEDAAASTDVRRAKRPKIS